MHRILFILMLIVYVTNSDISKTTEYCNWEVFQPFCEQNEVIIIKDAIYGRRTFARCLMDEGTPSDTFLRDPKFLGCFVDVNNIIEPICAGKNQCNVPVANIKTDTPCHKWLKLYLEVSYTCVEIIQDNTICIASIGNYKRYLSSHIRNECGSRQRPWTIDVDAGQRIKFTLTSFFIKTNYTDIKEIMYFQQSFTEQIKADCNAIGRITDKHNKNSVSICLGSGSVPERSTSFISSYDTVKIYFETDKTNKSHILTIEATGCSDLIPPSDAWLKRSENEATIGCYSTRLGWKLKCVGQRWVGIIGNCSQGYLEAEKGDVVLKNIPVESNDQLVQIVTLAVIGFVICFLIICVGVVYINRYYEMNKLRNIKAVESLKRHQDYEFSISKSGFRLDPTSNNSDCFKE